MTYFLTHTLKQLSSANSTRAAQAAWQTPSLCQDCLNVCSASLIACASTFVLVLDVLSLVTLLVAQKSFRAAHIFCSAAAGVDFAVDIKILINPRTLPRLPRSLPRPPSLPPLRLVALDGKASARQRASCGTHISMRRRVKRKRRICVIAFTPRLPPLQLPSPHPFACPLGPQLG